MTLNERLMGGNPLMGENNAEKNQWDNDIEELENLLYGDKPRPKKVDVVEEDAYTNGSTQWDEELEEMERLVYGKELPKVVETNAKVLEVKVVDSKDVKTNDEISFGMESYASNGKTSDYGDWSELKAPKVELKPLHRDLRRDRCKKSRHEVVSGSRIDMLRSIYMYRHVVSVRLDRIFSGGVILTRLSSPIETRQVDHMLLVIITDLDGVKGLGVQEWKRQRIETKSVKKTLVEDVSTVGSL
ncbi:unnamed protein product [Cochlearia groenlandica]